MNERYVYLKNGNETVKQEKFDYESKRLKIIEKWKKLYGKRFDGLVVIEDPKIKKPKQEKPKASRYAYGHILSTGKRSAKGFNKSWNGYKD